MSGPYERSLSSLRSALAEDGLLVTDELVLDGEPWLGRTNRVRSSRGVRWVLDGPGGASGSLTVVSDRPTGIELLTHRGPEGERVEACSLYPARLPDTDTDAYAVYAGLADEVRARLREGLHPRPFASNADVALVTSHGREERERVGRSLLDLVSDAATVVGHAVVRPYAAEAPSVAEALRVLADVAAGTPLEWALHRYRSDEEGA